MRSFQQQKEANSMAQEFQAMNLHRQQSAQFERAFSASSDSKAGLRGQRERATG